MNCAQARHLILTADLAAVRGESDPALRGHLDDCASCAAQAMWIARDTTRLRSALLARMTAPAVPAVTRWSGRRRAAVTLIPLALAAEITLLAFLANRESRPFAPPSRLDDSVYSTAPINLARHDSNVMIAPATQIADAPEAATSASALTRSSDDSALVGALESDAFDIPGVQVSPDGGQRAAVFTTSNPNITVVWLSKGDSL